LKLLSSFDNEVALDKLFAKIAGPKIFFKLDYYFQYY